MTSMDSQDVGVSGTVVRTSENPKYSVIELKDNARVTSSYGQVTADGIGGGGVAPGDEAVLFGDAAALARRAGTIGYEVLTSLGRRYARSHHG